MKGKSLLFINYQSTEYGKLQNKNVNRSVLISKVEIIYKWFSGVGDLQIRFDFRNTPKRPTQHDFGFNSRGYEHLTEHITADILKDIAEIIFIWPHWILHFLWALHCFPVFFQRFFKLLLRVRVKFSDLLKEMEFVCLKDLNWRYTVDRNNMLIWMLLNLLNFYGGHVFK